MILFRAHNLSSAGTILKQFACFTAVVINISTDGCFWWLAHFSSSIGSILADGLQNHGDNGLHQSSQRLTVALLRCLLFVPPHYTPFIYFQF